jgi:hypothetical protein
MEGQPARAEIDRLCRYFLKSPLLNSSLISSGLSLTLSIVLLKSNRQIEFGFQRLGNM